MNKSESIKNLAMAMTKAQAEMGGAHKGANNPFFKSKYADLGSVVEAVKAPFTNNGLSYVQFPIEQGGRIGVETILMHESGEWLSNEFTVNLTKQDAQSAGSALTYCRRYALQAVAGIPSEDDDGNGAIQQVKIEPNWYDDFDKHKSLMIKEIKSGEKTTGQIIAAIESKGFKVSGAIKQQIHKLGE